VNDRSLTGLAAGIFLRFVSKGSVLGGNFIIFSGLRLFLSLCPEEPLQDFATLYFSHTTGDYALVI
jgi:hypothetical protein